MRVGNAAHPVDLLVGTSGLNRWIEYNPADLTVTVETGLLFDEVQSELRHQQQFLPWDPPYAHDRTIGGIIASNLSGGLTCKYGPPRDRILGMEVVLADGASARCGGRVVKNVAGYDLAKLYAGSLGTLAIATEVSLKVTGLPEAFATYLVGFEQLAQALEQVEALLRAPIAPCAADLAMGSLITEIAAKWILAVRVDGSLPGVRHQIEQLQKVWPHGRVLESDTDASFWDRMVSERKRFAEPSRGVVLRLTGPLRLLEGAILHVHKWWNPVIRIHLLQNTAILMGAWDEAAALFQSSVLNWRAEHGFFGVRLTVEEAPVELKKDLECWDLQDGILSVLERIKNALDPTRGLSPGRGAGGL